MKIRFVELEEPLRLGGLEKAAADMARYIGGLGHAVVRDEGDLGDENWDLVHFHGLWSPDHARMCKECLQRGIPHIISPHGMLEPWAFQHKRWKKIPYFYLIEKRRLENCDAVMATAAEEKANLEKKLGRRHVQVLSLGIETPEVADTAACRSELGWKEDEWILLYLSRVHPKKGLKELMQSLEELRSGNRLPERIRLVVVGEAADAYGEGCVEMGKALAPQVTVEWIPPKWGEGKWPYLAGADVFCLPTYSENFGIVILEAGIVGTPVFTTTGTPWKVVEEAGFGRVPDPVPSGYAKVLEQFFAAGKVGPEKRQAFRSWTKTHFGWESLAPKYVELYANVINGELTG